jgi:hypothetical protein
MRSRDLTSLSRAWSEHNTPPAPFSTIRQEDHLVVVFVTNDHPSCGKRMLDAGVAPFPPQRNRRAETPQRAGAWP